MSQSLTIRLMSSSAAAPSLLHPADEATVRRRGDELRALATQHGISELRLASPGRGVGHVAEDRDALDTADVEITAGALLGAKIGLFSDRVLGKSHVSLDLLVAQSV